MAINGVVEGEVMAAIRSGEKRRLRDELMAWDSVEHPRGGSEQVCVEGEAATSRPVMGATRSGGGRRH